MQSLSRGTSKAEGCQSTAEPQAPRTVLLLAPRFVLVGNHVPFTGASAQWAKTTPPRSLITPARSELQRDRLRAVFLFVGVIGPLPRPGSWSEMKGHVFRFTYLASIATAMVGRVWLFVAMIEWAL